MFHQHWRAYCLTAMIGRGKIHQPTGEACFAHSQRVSGPLSSRLIIDTFKDATRDASPTTRHGRVAFLEAGRVR